MPPSTTPRKPATAASPGCERPGTRAFALLRHLAHRFLHFLRRHIAFVRSDRPAVPERILQLPVTVAPEHVGDRHRHLGPGRDGLFERGIGALYVKVNRD